MRHQLQSLVERLDALDRWQRVTLILAAPVALLFVWWTIQSLARSPYIFPWNFYYAFSDFIERTFYLALVVAFSLALRWAIIGRRT